MPSGTRVFQHDVDIRGFTLHNQYVDFQKNELRNALLQNLGVDISSGVVDGLFFYRTDSDRVRVRANGVWQDVAWVSELGSSAIPQSLADTKGDLAVATANDTFGKLAAGANGTLLVANSATGTGLEWRVIADADLPGTITRDSEVFLLSAYTTKGDLGIATGSGAVARHGVGANGTFLVANSANGDGWENRAITAADIQEKIATADLTDWPRVAALDMNSQKITGLLDGTAAQDAATFGQVNAIVEGRSFKTIPADVATTGVLPNTPTYNSGAGTLTSSGNAAFPTMDANVAPFLGMSVLVKDQVNTFEDGLYTLTQLGSGAATWILTRRADANTFGELQAGTSVYVSGGATHIGDTFTQTATLANLTASTQTWTKTGNSNTVYTADETSLTLSGTVFSEKLAGTTNAKLADMVQASIKGRAAAGGTGVPQDLTAAQVKTILALASTDLSDTAALTRKAVGALTGGANTEVLTHNLNTRDVRVTIRNNASPYEEVDVYSEALTVNAVTIYAATGVNLPASYRWLVIG